VVKPQQQQQRGLDVVTNQQQQYPTSGAALLPNAESWPEGAIQSPLYSV
jgi:hypothetical protein